MRHMFGSLRHHSLWCSHSLSAISFIRVNSVLLLNVLHCRFQRKIFCLGMKNLILQDLTCLLRVTKLSGHEVLVQHMVDVLKATAEFRDASEMKDATSSLMNSSSKCYAARSIVQRKLCVYNWNSEKQIAGRWYVITLQEASDYIHHALLTSRFHVTHFLGCAVLFKKDTFYTDVRVKSLYLHDTRRDSTVQVVEGDLGWVLQGVLSRATFRRPSVSGQKHFTVLSFHINNNYAKQKGIAQKLILTTI